MVHTNLHSWLGWLECSGVRLGLRQSVPLAGPIWGCCLFLMSVLLITLKKLKSALSVCLCLISLSCWSLFFASFCSFLYFSSFLLTALNMSSHSLSTCFSALSLSLVFTILMLCGVNVGTGNSVSDFSEFFFYADRVLSPPLLGVVCLRSKVHIPCMHLLHFPLKVLSFS